MKAELEKAAANTKNFNKVTDDMKTKNQNVSKVVKEEDIKKVNKKSRITGEKRIDIENEQKWTISNIDGDKKIEIKISETKQSVYVYKVDNSNIIIKGKCTTITMDDCRKSVLIFEDVIACCEVVNCKSVTVQSLSKIPSFNVDKTDGIVVYLSLESKFATIVTSKSSEMNVVIPSENEEDDPKELPIPEQFITSYDSITNTIKTGSNAHF